MLQAACPRRKIPAAPSLAPPNHALTNEIHTARNGSQLFEAPLSYRPPPGASVADVTISGLGSSVLPALSHPDQANRLFVDHVLLAVGVHIAQTYGGMRPVSRLVRGGLAPWQERRAKEMIAANLDGVR